MHAGHAARVPALLMVLGLVSTATSSPAHDLSYSFRMDLDEDQRITSCSDFEMRFGKEGDRDVVTVRRDKSMVLTAPSSGPLRVRPGEHGGVCVQPSTDGGYSALVCLAAGARDPKDADAILDRIEIENTGGTLSVSGPEKDWAVYVVLSVPRDVTLDLSTTNGPLSLREVSGRFTLRATNGPITIAGTTGVVDAEAVNGPIKFRGHAGDVRLAAQNGPMKVTLDDAKWSGKGLEGSTQNGPVKLEAPAALQAGIEVQGSWHSPIKVNGVKSWERYPHDGARLYRLGSGPVMIHLSTVNGPLEIRGPKPGGKTEEI
jgi:hypothetical protein